MKKIMLLLSLAAALVLFGCANSSSGSDDDTPVPAVSQQSSTATPELPATYVDISGTWYYTKIWNGQPFGEYKAVFEYKPLEKPKVGQEDLNFPLGIVTKLSVYDTNGYFLYDLSLVYDRGTNILYRSNIDDSIITSISNDRILFKVNKISKAQSILSTEGLETVLSKTPTAGGSGSSSGSGGNVTLSGTYNAAERSGVTITFNNDGTWTQSYPGAPGTQGTFTLTGSNLTVNFSKLSQNYSGVFTVSEDNGSTILTADSGDTLEIIAIAWGITTSQTKVTLSK